MRYLILIFLNIPVIFIATLNLITQFKMKRMSSRKFKQQLILWLLIMIVLLGSFPVYNAIKGNAILDSSELTLFDIAQTTVIVFMIYVLSNYRRKLDNTERVLRELHQEISIKLSGK